MRRLPPGLFQNPAPLVLTLLVLLPGAAVRGQDCNSNGIPDSDDLAAGVSFDRNGNGVPDECERCSGAATFELFPDDGLAFDRFASALALTGDIMVVGAPYRDAGALDAGVVYVFRFAAGEWIQAAALSAPDAAASDHFGGAVAIDGGRIVIGAPEDDDRGSNSGSAYVYRFDGAEWALETKLHAEDALAGDAFGSQVALRGDRAVVAAPRRDASGTDSGAVYIFRFDGSAWSHEARIAPSDGLAGDDFGRAIALGDGVLLVGAPLVDTGAANTGAAYIYRLTPAGWSLETRLTATDPAAFDQFGRAVALDGDRAAIGAPEDDDAGANSGSVYVYRRSSGSWAQEAKFHGFDAVAGDRFGEALAMSGGRIAVGATGADAGGMNAGAVYLMSDFGSDWSASGKLTASTAAASDAFGNPVCLEGERLVGGAWQHDWLGTSSGVACVFHGVNDCNENLRLDLCDLADGTSGDRNGNLVPDECDPDCNQNGVPDDLDLASGVGADCNGNGAPDDCDIASGASRDCDGNGVPDECDLASGAGADCNANGIPDPCDLAAGSSADCNANGIPDECDMASGASADCNANGAPDECDIAGGLSNDCDGDGDPDECQPDADGDSVIDACDECADTAGDATVGPNGCPISAEPGVEPSPDDWVELCHVPPGRPDERHTIRVSADAVADHLAHGDSLGPCESVDHDTKRSRDHHGDSDESAERTRLQDLRMMFPLGACGAGVAPMLALTLAGLAAYRAGCDGVRRNRR
jgi:hypothetical protein